MHGNVKQEIRVQEREKKGRDIRRGTSASANGVYIGARKGVDFLEQNLLVTGRDGKDSIGFPGANGGNWGRHDNGQRSYKKKSSKSPLGKKITRLQEGHIIQKGNCHS